MWGSQSWLRRTFLGPARAPLKAGCRQDCLPKLPIRLSLKYASPNMHETCEPSMLPYGLKSGNLPGPASISARRWPYLVFLAAYFCYFALDSLRARFAPDDMMNIDIYWSEGWWCMLLSQVDIFHNHLRPGGGLFYLPIFQFADLNPLPYHVALILIMAANVVVGYRFAKLLTGSAAVGGLTALIVCCHGRMGALYYHPSTIYDVTCFFFYFAAFGYYLSIRTKYELPGLRQSVIFLFLNLGAINFKEMAFTLPLMLLLYELLYHPPAKYGWKELFNWCMREGRIALASGTLTAICAYSKLSAGDSLLKIEAYRPVFNLETFLDHNWRFLNEILCFKGLISREMALAIWVLLLAIAWFSKRPHLRFCWLFNLLSTLPIVFVPTRGDASLFVPLMGWAIFAATLAWDVIDFLARRYPFRLLPSPSAHILLTLLFVLALGYKTETEKSRLLPYFQESQALTWSVIQQFKAQKPVFPHKSSVIFLHDPFEGWDLIFIAKLYSRDPSVRFMLARLALPPPTDQDIAKFDYVLDYQHGNLLQIKPRTN
jgi:hypothetical protein